jgi:hypothetical protein
MNSSDIKNALLNKYSTPEYETFFEVSDGTGANVSGWLDVMAFSMYPSRGLLTIGIEVKISKSDFKSEIKNPEKAEKFARFCDYFYFATPKGLVDKEDVPLNWGLLEVDENLKVKEVKRATKLTPIEMTKSFIFSLLRSANKHYRNNEAELRNEIHKNYYEDIRREIERREQDRVSRFGNQGRINNIIKFEELTGINFDNNEVNRNYLNNKDLAKVFNLALNITKLKDGWDGVDNLVKHVENVLATYKEVNKELESLMLKDDK